MILKTKKYGEIDILIDNEDVALASNYKLCVSYAKNTSSFYVMTSDRKYLHRLIMNAQKGQVVDHINHNTLDNRRGNLRLVSHSENALNSLRAYTDTQKLSEKQVGEIIKSELPLRELSKKFGVSNCLISKIKTGEMYSNYCVDIKRQEKKMGIFGEERPMFEKRAIKREVMDGGRIKIISEKWGIASETLYRIKNNKIWRKVKPL
jgi:hypothetical protein